MEKLKSDNISELGLPCCVESNLEWKGIKTISEIVNQSKNGRLYEIIYYKETLKIINYKLQKYGLKLWNYDDEEVLSQGDICYLYCQYDGSDNPLHYSGINNIELLTSLTKTELEKLFNISKREVKRIIKTVHSYGLKFADEIEENISIERKPFITLGLSKRAIHILMRGNIYSVSELIAKTRNELRQLAGMGHKTYAEIIETIYSLGLKFAGDSKENIGIENDLITVLDLPAKARDILQHTNIHLVSELIAKTRNELRQLAGMDYLTYIQIIERIYSLGLKFADECEEENTIVQNDIVEPINDTPSVSEQMNQSKLDKLARIQELQNQIIALQQEQSILMQELNEELSKGDIHARQSK